MKKLTVISALLATTLALLGADVPNIQKSVWTTSTNPATARTGLSVLSATETTNAMLSVASAISGPTNGMTAFQVAEQIASSNLLSAASLPTLATLQAATNAAEYIANLAVSTINSGATNIELYGAKHSTRQLIGNITSGSATITITSGSVSSADVGRHANVRFGTSPVQDAVGTVSSVGSGTFNLSKTCGWSTNGVDIYIAADDDADALQSALNDAQAKGGATILCPPGIYWLSHPVY